MITMTDSDISPWRHSAYLISKYNPEFRDEKGYYTKDEWLGFFDVGKEVNGEVLTIEQYLMAEKKYIEAAKLFFQLHECRQVVLENVEKLDYSPYTLKDKDELIKYYNAIRNVIERGHQLIIVVR